MERRTLTGGCSCGAVRYEIARCQPFHVCHCHCRLCRGSTGAVMVTWMTVPQACFRIAKGEESLRTFVSSEVGERHFCAACGSHLTFVHRDFADDIDVTVASLDNPERLPPETHIWTDSRIAWIAIDEHLPKRRQD